MGNVADGWNHCIVVLYSETFPQNMYLYFIFDSFLLYPVRMTFQYKAAALETVCFLMLRGLYQVIDIFSL